MPTTSSSAKFDLLKSLGADHIINYREDTNWGATARKVTANEEGFDHILDVGGYDTMSHSLNAIKFEGVITIIGFLSGRYPPDSMADILLKICTVRGIHVGSRVHMEEMMAAIEANGIQPVLDKKVFALEEVREGLVHLVGSIRPHSLPVDWTAQGPRGSNILYRRLRSMWAKSQSTLSKEPATRLRADDYR